MAFIKIEFLRTYKDKQFFCRNCIQDITIKNMGIQTFNFVAKIVMKRMGFLKPYNIGPGWLQFANPSVADVRSTLDLEFEHVLPCHGDAVIGGAKEKYRPAIEGELKGAV